jgi:hypothetical protein
MSDEQNDDEKERRRAEDGSEFGLDNTIGTGDATAEVTATSNNKLLLIGIIAGAISILLVACITIGFIGYAMTSRKGDAKADDVAKNMPLEPAVEAKAKIKSIDRDARSMRFLMFNNTRRAYQVTDKTDFLDREGNPLPKGLEDAALREDEYCVILPTDDQTSLRWLKLTAPPK